MKVFENLFQRHFEYEYDSDSTVNGISVKVFKEKDLASKEGDSLATTPGGTLSLGPAFNLDLVIARQGCLSCDDSLTSSIMVNNVPYKTAV